MRLGVVQMRQVRFGLQTEPASKVLKGVKAHGEKVAPPTACAV